MVNTAAEKAAADSTDTIVVDLGKRKRKAIKRLRDGSGTLLEEINECVGELRASGDIKKDAQTVIVLVREKPKKRGILPTLY